MILVGLGHQVAAVVRPGGLLGLVDGIEHRVEHGNEVLVDLSLVSHTLWSTPLGCRSWVCSTTATFEGASNPDDRTVGFGLRCAACGVRGVLVAAYGPTATAEEAAVVTAFSPRAAP